MSKTKSAIQASNGEIIFSPAPQVVALATAAVGRLQKLLTICDSQIAALETKSASAKDFPHRELLTLARMVLNFQKDLEKYAAIVYPATKEFSSSVKTEHPQGNTINQIDSTKDLERDSISSSTRPHTATAIKANPNNQSAVAHHNTPQHYATPPHYTDNNNLNSDLEIQNKEEIMTGNGKNASKKPKVFSGIFPKQCSEEAVINFRGHGITI